MKVVKLFAVLAIVILVIPIACERKIDSKDPLRSVPEVGFPPKNLQIRLDSSSVHLSWEKSDMASIAGYRVFVFDSSFTDTSIVAEPLSFRDTTALQMSFDNLILNQLYYFQIAALIGSGLEGTRSAAASVRIILFSIEINGNDKLTKSRDVQLAVNAFNLPTHMKVSEDSLFALDEFKPFVASSQFTLSETDGLKTIYCALLFANGSQTSGLISDNIILDTRAEIDSVSFAPVGTSTTGDTVRFMVYASEADGKASVSFAGATNMELYDDATHFDNTLDDGIYTGFYVVPVNFSMTDGIVTGSFTDEAGNQTTLASDVTLSIVSTPLPVNLSAIALSTFQVSLSWTSSLSSDFLAYRIYRSQSSPVTTSSELIQSIPNSVTKSFTDTTAAEGSTYYYKVFVFTTAGNSSESNEVSVTTDNNVAPSAVVLSLSAQVDASVLLTWTVSDESDFQYYTVHRDTLSDPNSAVAVTIINSRNITNYTAIRPDTSLVYYFQVFVHDRHGLMTGSNILSVP